MLKRNYGIMGDAEIWGFIPSFLDVNDPRSVREQFNEKYIGGWHPFQGFSLDKKTGTLTYPGDPSMEPRGFIIYGEEVIVLYPHSWVLVMQKDDSWEIARMD